MTRIGEIRRTTKETDLHVVVALDGRGESSVHTGIGFFDHMLEALARHALLDLTVEAQGDLHVDGHHTVEDTGIALGLALERALGDRAGIRRYAAAMVPLVDALVLNAGLTVHMDLIRGDNPHHIVEATFKAFARALDGATSLDPRVTGVPSTKGAL